MEDARIVSFIKDVEKALEHLHGEFAKLQTGRATAALVDSTSVEAYGQRQPLKAIASVSIQDSRTILIQPWDKSVIGNVERALQALDLGASPVSDGVGIRISLPPMTQERREQLKKVVAKLAEETKISIRQHRQKIHDDIKAQEKDEDMRFTLLEILQKEVDKANGLVETSLGKKEEEIMTV